MYSKNCVKCGTAFSQTNRDHHCRHCGQNFCADCCNNFTPIPKFGSFLKKLRVCNDCLQTLQRTGQTSINIQQAPTPSVTTLRTLDSPISSKSSVDDELWNIPSEFESNRAKSFCLHGGKSKVFLGIQGFDGEFFPWQFLGPFIIPVHTVNWILGIPWFSTLLEVVWGCNP